MKYLSISLLLVSLFSVTFSAFAQQTPTWQPREGDMILYRGPVWSQRLLTTMATGDSITHSALVIKNHEGDLEILHALGNNDSISVKSNPSDLFGVVKEPLLSSLYKERYRYKQEMYVRAIKRQLTSEESKRLTDFAYRQLGKPFSAETMLKPLDPLFIQRESPLKKKPEITESDSYMCSQLLSDSCIYAGLFSPYINSPGMYPADFFYGKRLNIKENIDFGFNKLWNPPVLLIFDTPIPPPLYDQKETMCPFPLDKLRAVFFRLRGIAYQKIDFNQERVVIDGLLTRRQIILRFLNATNIAYACAERSKASADIRRLISKYFSDFKGKLDPDSTTKKYDNGNVSDESATLLRNLNDALLQFESCLPTVSDQVGPKSQK